MSLLDILWRKPAAEGADGSPRRGIFYGWWIVTAGVAINAVGGWLHVYGFGAFFLPLVREFGWNRASLSGALSIARLEAGMLAPLVGWVVDRFGPRTSMIVGFLITGIGFLGAGLIIFQDHKVSGLTTAASLWAACGVGMAVGFKLYFEALSATVLILFAFTLLWFVEDWLKKIAHKYFKEEM
jgi:MFS family permease